MKKNIIHNGFFRLLVPAIYGILVYLMILLINNDVSQLTALFSGQEVYVCIGLSYLMVESIRFTAIGFEKIGRQTFGNKLIMQLLTSIVVVMIVTTLAISAYFKYVLNFGIAETQLYIFNGLYGVSSLLFNLLYFSNLYLHKQNIEKLNEEQLLTDLLEAELIKFKNEVNPNLLYDSLETLITLVHKNAEESEEYIDHLSAVYRYILSHRKTEFSTLKDEINAARHIVHLLNYQHNGKIELQANSLTNFENTPLVPGTLPDLIERAIRNTIINNFSPLTLNLEVAESDGYLILEYKLNDKLLPESDYIFENILKSYQFYTERPVVQIKAYDRQYVKIPLLEVVEETLISEQETATT